MAVTTIAIIIVIMIAIVVVVGIIQRIKVRQVLVQAETKIKIRMVH